MELPTIGLLQSQMFGGGGGGGGEDSDQPGNETMLLQESV